MESNVSFSKSYELVVTGVEVDMSGSVVSQAEILILWDMLTALPQVEVRND